jgi:hypothetical protein
MKMRQETENIERKGYRLPEEGLVRLPDILRVIPISTDAWYKGIRRGNIPETDKAAWWPRVGLAG